MFMLIGALVGAGASFYASNQQKALSKQVLAYQEQQAATSQRTWISMLEIGGAAVALFSIAWVVAKKA